MKIITKSLVIIMVMGLSGLTLVFPLDGFAQTSTSDPEALVDQVLCSMNLGCSSTNTTRTATSNTATANVSTSSGTTSSSNSGGGFFSSLFGFGNGSSRRVSSILYGATIVRDFTKNEITLVRVARSDSVPGELKPDEIVYEIIRGKKHQIPTMDIFFDYGFNPQWVQFISGQQLNKYTRIKIVRVEGDKKHAYYITDNGLIRPILSEDIIRSYGERTEDLIIISRKEFNYYPENKYIYLDQPTTRDVYLISGETKRYLTPMSVQRLGISLSQVAPVNAVEFNGYKTGEPILY